MSPAAAGKLEKPPVLRDPEEIQRYVLQGLWLQRTVQPTAATVKHALEWAMEIAAGGQPLPPVGFVADLGHAAFGMDRGESRARGDALVIPGLPPGLARTYEDHVLGKIYADWTFERASDAMRRYQGRDRARGLAYVVKQMRERGGFGGVELPPGPIRSMLDSSPDELLRRGFDLLSQHGPMQLLIDLYESLIAAARRMAEVLGTEDVIALEQRTALADMGQYVAHRQVLQMANRLEAGLPKQRVRPLAGRQEVPTRVLDEDTYPVGGFSSISTRGSIESLLHSQLAYMEKDKELQPDLFDVKFLRDELYYYSRDENQFLRRRRTFVFALYPDLVKARFKDPDLPCQRIVLVLSTLLLAVHKLSEWLSTDALKFEILFVQDAEPGLSQEDLKKTAPLAQEAQLLEILLREQIENGTVSVQHFADPGRVGPHCAERARKSMCHCLAFSTAGVGLEADDSVVTQIRVAGAKPEIGPRDDEPEALEADDALECWTLTLERLLQLWV